MDDVVMAIEHARTALGNVQGNIRHIDTKVAGAMGVVAVVLGLCISRPVLARQLCFSSDTSWWCRAPMLILMVAAGIALVFAAYHASQTLYPRKTANPRLKSKMWMLFPIAEKDVDELILREDMEKSFAKGMTKETILGEYLDQLAILGHIQTQKMKACCSLFKWLWGFCAAMFLLGCVSFVCYLCHPL